MRTLRAASSRSPATAVLGLLFLVLAGSGIVALSAGQSQPGPGKPPPVGLILITIDTLRADHVSCLDPGSPVKTPALDSLAKEGILFANAYTSTPLTLPAHATLMTGLWPMAHGVRDFTGNRLEPDRATLAGTLQQAGFATAGFVSAAVLDHRSGISRGMATYNDSFGGFLGGDARVAERPGRETLDLAKEWLRSSRRGRFFLWIHLYEPHDPYTPPEPFRSRHAGHPYAGEVAYVDSLVGGFLERLKEAGLYDQAVIAVVSDHGEGLGEHGESRHGFFLYQSTVHVPWIMRLPGGVGAGKRVESNVSLVDFFPTALQALQVDRKLWPPDLQGRGRYRLFVSERETGKDEIYFETPVPRNHFGWSDLRGIVQGKLKFIDAPRPELYDLGDDPGERRNLFEARLALGRQYLETLRSLETRYAAEKAPASGVDPELEAQLRSLGYVGLAAPKIETKSREGLEDPKAKIGVYETFQQGVEAAREGRWAEAIRLLQSASSGAPGSVAVASSLAGAYRNSGQFEKASEWFEKVLQLRPEDVFTRGEYAQLLVRLGRPQEARAQLEAALAVAPRDFQTLFNLGSMKAMDSEFEDAIPLLQRAAEIKRDGGVLRSLALAEQYAGRLTDAETHLLEAIRLDPGDRKAHLQLSGLYRQMGREKEALEQLTLSRSP